MLVTLLGITVFLQPTIKVLEAVSIIPLQLFRESYWVFPLDTVIEVNPLQPLKARLSIFVTLFGIVMDVNPLQSMKA